MAKQGSPFLFLCEELTNKGCKTCSGKLLLVLGEFSPKRFLLFDRRAF